MHGAGVQVVLMAAVLAGCLGGPGASHVPANPSTPNHVEAPPGCDAGRRAAPHHPAADPINESGRAPIPCLFRTGLASFEPSIGITNQGTVFLGWAGDQFSATSPEPASVARSRDHGRSWSRVTPNAAGESTHPTTEDFYLYVDPATGRLFVADLQGVDCATISWTDDDGSTWQTSAAGCVQFDHEAIVAGRPVTSTTNGYPDLVYYCAANLVATSAASTTSSCEKSTDGGMTFVPTGEPAFTADPTMVGGPGAPQNCGGLHGHPATDSRGWLYLPKGHCGEPWLAISHDEGRTWTRVKVSDLGIAGGADGHEAGVGVDPQGNIFYGWVAQDGLPYVSTSQDQGRTWSAPRMVGAPGVVATTLGELAVGGTGRVAVAYMGSLGGTGQGQTWNGYIGMTVDALASDPTFFSAPVNPPSDPLVRGPCNFFKCQQVGDFIDVRIDPEGRPWASFVDGCKDSCAASTDGTDNAQEGVAGELWGGPSLWDPDHPSGPFSR